MKREGRQHGMVRTYHISTSYNRRTVTGYAKGFDYVPTVGLFSRVSRKPTNNSKFTGKCRGSKCSNCHLNPACKSKDKAKGTQKLRSRVTSSDYNLLTWRAVDGIWDYLGDDYMDDDDDNDDDDDDGDGVDEDSVNEYVGVVIKNGDHDNDGMGFCDLGLWWDQVEGDEVWCMVGDNVIA